MGLRIQLSIHLKETSNPECFLTLLCLKSLRKMANELRAYSQPHVPYLLFWNVQGLPFTRTKLSVGVIRV